MQQYTVTCSLSGCARFFHIISLTAQISGGGGGIVEDKMCDLIFSTRGSQKVPGIVV
jgi:hypothetical protein